MNLPPDAVIEERLTNFSNTRLRELARATGLVQREGGKLEADALFWALTIGFLSNNYRTFEAFRQEYIDTFGDSLRYASFYEWFTPALCEFLREVLKAALEDLESEDDPAGQLTDRQQEIVRAAIAAGYYDIPRGTTPRELATELGLSQRMIGEHLQRAEAKIIQSVVV